MNSIPILTAVIGVCTLVWVVHLYRRYRLKEELALLWVSVAVGIILLSTLSYVAVATNPIAILFDSADFVIAVIALFLIIVCVRHSAKISEIIDQNRKIAQEIALLRGTSTPPTEDIRQKDES